MRKNTLVNQLKKNLEEISGIEMQDVAPSMSFIEIGLDSLLLTQIALLLKREYKTPITFRQLNEEYNNLNALANYLDESLPAEEMEPFKEETLPKEIVHNPSIHEQLETPLATSPTSTNQSSVLQLISQQIQLLAQQVAILSTEFNAEQPKAKIGIDQKLPVVQNGTLSAKEMQDLRKPFGAIAKIEKKSSTLNPKQAKYLIEFTKRYNAKTKASKAYTQQHRTYMADPRVVSGFKPLTKELVYSIVTNRSKGCYLWDIDGNKYIDLLNGFGSNMLGYQPDHIKAAILDQIEKGFEIGPQHKLAGEVSQLFTELTNTERAALCNTGSEAVLGAIRIARTVTGRPLIVSFTGSYHGIIDEVLVRGTQKLKSFPAAPGIMPESVENILVLEYGSDESLRIIQERGKDIAAVLVEPIQSRNPELQPIEFLKKLRDITTQTGSILVFDEIITGFRHHQRGAQGLFDIQADIGTYGKVVGAGLPIGVIAGKKEYLDAFDGGYWQYGDASIPEVGVTYFAGTFVRHPLALAAAKASLLYMKEKGNALQENLTQKTLYLANAINEFCSDLEVPIYIAHFGSMMKFKYKEEYPHSELLYILMREKGIHIQDGFPCFMTEAHTQQELDTIIEVVKVSIKELVAAEFIPSTKKAPSQVSSSNLITNEHPPLPDARLGRDENGNPAWFISDPDRVGKYLQIDI